MKKSNVLAYKVKNPVIWFLRKFILTIVFVSYYVWAIWIFQTSAKTSKAECNRIEPKYVTCQQIQLNLSHSLKPKVTSFRLFNAAIGPISGQVSGFSYNSEPSKDRFEWLENSYGIYLETNEKLLLLQYGYSSLPKAQKAEDYVNKYIQGEGIPSRTLRINKSNEDFLDNMKILGIVLINLLFISYSSKILISYYYCKNHEVRIQKD